MKELLETLATWEAGGTTGADVGRAVVVRTFGSAPRPEGANLSSRGRVKHASLITIRPHFLRELINMARDV